MRSNASPDQRVTTVYRSIWPGMVGEAGHYLNSSAEFTGGLLELLRKADLRSLDAPLALIRHAPSRVSP
jgi:hypothetical protein